MEKVRENTKFGRWTTIKKSNKKNGRIYWLCRCECGTIKEVLSQNLLNGSSQSCGCWNREKASERMSELREKCGFPSDGRKNTRLYLCWQNTMRRCYKTDPFKRYKARGITVVDAWHKFENFRDWAIQNGYRDDLTIDRINNDGVYSPDNCRWVGLKIQGRNKSSNHLVTYQGRQYCLQELSEKLCIPRKTISRRLEKGIPLDLPFHERAKYAYKGKCRTLAEIGRMIGLSPTAVKNRIKKNIPLDAPIDEIRRNNRLKN